MARDDGRDPARVMRTSASPKSPSFVPVVFSLLLITSSLVLQPLCPGAASAAESPKPFETITLGAQLLANVGRSEFHDYWDPSNGARFEFGTPFYLGTVQTGIHIFQNDNVAPEVPGFHSVFVYLGWGYEWNLPFDAGWFAGIQTGGFYMDFEDDDVADEGKTESELGFGLHTSLRYPTGTRWSALVTADYRRIYTHRRIDHFFVGAGLSYTLTTPRWLRGFLE